jgi:glycosyltransferase involved in cell wall biosynthesis
VRTVRSPGLLGRNNALQREELLRRLDGRRVVNLVLNVSPYHVPRFRDLTRAFAELGAAYSVLELAAVQKDWPWILNRERPPFERHTLFEDRPVESLTHIEQHRAVVAALDRLDPAVVIIPGWSHGFQQGGIQWARRRKRICIVQGDSPYMQRDGDGRSIRRKWPAEVAKRWLLRGVDAAQGAGETSARYFVRLGLPRERVVLKLDVVENGYFANIAEQTRANASAERTALSVPGRYFFYPCRFLALKNHLRLLDAYRRYAAKAGASAWGLVLVGSGEQDAAVDAWLAANPLPGVIRRAYAPIEDIARYYALASALIFPSWAETWGLIVNEAAAAGLPLLLSTEVLAGEHLLVEGRNGWSFNPYDVESMTVAMLRMTELPEVALAAMGRASAELVRDWDVKDHVEELMKACTIGLLRKLR